nr:hypothetical protein B0A51_06197 [Rachicladosporium sp. CCFEE 5018]
MADLGKCNGYQNLHSLYSHRRNDSRASTPCMPTPETSQSSDTSMDEHFARPLASRGASIRALLSDEACEPTVACNRSDDNLSARMITRPKGSARYAPCSPPYRSGSELRPSLPPLKTILAVPLSSPPTTPRLYDAAFPLAAREPSYVATTFKPPAFYPNKKPRTTLSPRHSPSFAPEGMSISSDRSATARVDYSARFSRPSMTMDTEYFKSPDVWPEGVQPSARARLDEWTTRYEARQGEVLAADIVAPDRRAAFFMPSHYEYQQGKTRKRSNLPKQSTEIMKYWFDQNIANPYRSEEQKQVFANATGISMTQVSNWFINHRRRCPELRDKRDRSRVGGGDLSD